MPESNRVQRWRETKRQAGLKAVTVWLTIDAELRLKDLALQGHCSPSAMVQQALAQFTPATPAGISAATDTTLLRQLIREELAAMQATLTPATDTATVVPTDTSIKISTMETTPASKTGHVTVTNSYVTDTEAPGEAPVQRKGGRPRGTMHQRILGLLTDHPEGLSAEAIRVHLNASKPLGDTLQGMRRQRVVKTRGSGRAIRYFLG